MMPITFSTAAGYQPNYESYAAFQLYPCPPKATITIVYKERLAPGWQSCEKQVVVPVCS